jgi:CheY-like chemotaxis protein
MMRNQGKAPSAKPKILLVEDNPADADLTQLAFEIVGTPTEFDVLPNGEEAINYLSRQGSYSEAQSPQLVLLDLNLPRVGGLEVLATIKSLEATRHTPVVVLTSSESADDIAKSYQRMCTSSGSSSRSCRSQGEGHCMTIDGKHAPAAVDREGPAEGLRSWPIGAAGRGQSG